MDNSNVQVDNNPNFLDKVYIIDVASQVKKHYKAMIVIFVIFALVGYSFSFFKQPVYNSTSTMTVMYEEKFGESASGSYVYSSYITDTFCRLITEDTVLKEVAAETGYSLSTIKANFTVESNNLLLDLSYRDTNPTNAKRILNRIMNKSIEIFDSVDESGKPNYVLLQGNLKVFSPASDAREISTLGTEFYVFVALGVASAFLYAVFFSLLGKKYTSADEIESALDMPVLTTVPYYDFIKRGKTR